jgi:hypothetical protein
MGILLISIRVLAIEWARDLECPRKTATASGPLSLVQVTFLEARLLGPSLLYIQTLATRYRRHSITVPQRKKETLEETLRMKEKKKAFLMWQLIY